MRLRYNGGGHIWVKPSTKPSERPRPEPLKPDPYPDHIDRDPLWMIVLSLVLGPLVRKGL